MRHVPLVFAGAALGALGRWIVALRVPVETGTFPWATFIVNIAGCALIGYAARKIERNSAQWAFAVTGVLGGFTTMSSLSLELFGLASGDDTFFLGLLYMTATFSCGYMAAYFVRGDL